ncbi:MAG: AAA family ATPase [Chloroflexota bacterium]
MTCPSCGAENGATARFCSECGTRLAQACPSCGAPHAPGARFCSECGTPLTGGATAPARPAAAGVPALAPAAHVAPEPAPVAERRLVTVLFADLVGFTPWSEGRDPEEVRETLTRYFEMAREVITRYGGVVEKFIGDAVMAVWGAPVARENDAERAVRAALDLLAGLPQLAPGITGRAGLLTGEAAVTLGADGQGMVAGDLVNTAARLQSAAEPGTVLAGEPTMRAAAAAIAFEPAGERALKGKAAPVPAWVARRVVAEVGGRGRSEGLEAPFVGRDDEIRLLRDLFHATAREQRARLVSVVGPAGIGKSRLAWEFLKYIDGLVDGVWWHQGRSPAYGEGITFWALGEMIRSRCRLLEADDESTTRRKVAETVARFVPDETERRWIEPALLALLGSGERGRASEQLFAAWRTFFERMAQQDPVVLVFEDLHWADTGTIDFIDHLLDWSKGVPLYVVTLARPELLDRRADWGAGKRSFTSLFLEPLSEAAMEALLDGLVPGLPDTTRRAIVARADGIPLYAVETVRMLVNDGRLVLRDGIYTPAGDLSTLAVPESLTALIAARLDALDPADRALMLDASVLGQSFSPAALAAVSGTDQSLLVPRLRGLVRRELLTIEADPRSPELGQYAFVQALIREVAYGTLARRDRKARHLAAARWFESIGSDELAGALAGQYLAAHANATEPEEQAALAAQARVALRGAADRAAALGAHEQAAGFLLQALEVTAEPAEQAALLSAAGSALSWAGQHERACVLLGRCVELQEQLGDRAAAANALALQGGSLIDSADFAAATALLEQARKDYADLGTSAPALRVNAMLARAYLLSDRQSECVVISDEVLTVAEEAHEVDVIADVLVSRGSALAAMGQRYGGLGAIRAGEELARTYQLWGTVLRALNNVAAHGSAGDPTMAWLAAREGLTLARRLGERSLAAFLLGNAIESAIDAGRWDWIREERPDEQDLDGLEGADRAALLYSVLEFRVLIGEPIEDAEWQTFLDLIGGLQSMYSTLAVAIRRYLDGDSAGARADMHRRAGSDKINAPSSLLLAAQIAAFSGDLVGLRDDLAAYRATRARGPVIAGHHLELEAATLALEGRREDALRGFREAIAIFRDLDLPWQEALAGYTVACCLGTADDTRDILETTLTIMDTLGAAPFAARVRAVLAGGPTDAASQATRVR